MEIHFPDDDEKSEDFKIHYSFQGTCIFGYFRTGARTPRTHPLHAPLSSKLEDFVACVPGEGTQSDVFETSLL